MIPSVRKPPLKNQKSDFRTELANTDKKGLSELTYINNPVGINHQQGIRKENSQRTVGMHCESWRKATGDKSCRRRVCKVELTERGSNSLNNLCLIAGLWYEKNFHSAHMWNSQPGKAQLEMLAIPFDKSGTGTKEISIILVRLKGRNTAFDY